MPTQSDADYSLKYGRAATPEVRGLLHEAVRPHLHDVRAMLRLPLPSAGITAGCNFAAVHVLLNVLSGLARLMGPGPSNSGDHFKQFVRRRYPWRLEPSEAYTARGGADALYRLFRNGFAHDLGLLLETRPTAKTRVRLRFRTKQPIVAVKKKPSCTGNELEMLDDVSARPAWLGPTVHVDEHGGVVVDALALYWGVRRLVFDHTDDPAAIVSLKTMIARTWSRRKKDGLVQTIKQTASGALLVDGKVIETMEQFDRELANGKTGARNRRRTASARKVRPS